VQNWFVNLRCNLYAYITFLVLCINNGFTIQLVGCFNGDATRQKQYPKESIPHKVTTQKCAEYSYEEYYKVQGKINSMSTKFNFNHLKVTKNLHTVTSNADTQGFVAVDKTNCEVFIVFRGTDSIDDYRNNLIASFWKQ